LRKAAKLKKRTEAKKLLSSSFNSRERVIKININNTFEHELSKFILCWELAKIGKSFVTEAIFSNNSRADIFVLDDLEVIEILYSEDLKKLKRKINKYPCQITYIETKKALSYLKKYLGDKYEKQEL
jgi:hypothetical protein